MSPEHRIRQSARIFRANAAAACDASGFITRPASVVAQVESWPALRILAIGKPADVDHHPASAAAELVSFPNSLLTPAFANIHTHLDLTHIGPQPHDPSRGFVPWVDMVRSRRHANPAEIASSVRRGVELSLAGAVVAVGDIAGAPGGMPSISPYRTLAASPLRGVSYLEFFGIGATVDRAKDHLRAAISELGIRDHRVELGLQPHAPNTVDLRLYQWAVDLAQRNRLPLSTHLAETPEEAEFIAHARGPQRLFLERMGIWNDSILDHLGRGAHPVQHLRSVLSLAPFTVAHVNNADDAAIEVLAQARATVAYCPRASAYFAAESHFGPHRYRDMLRAGVNVALGTDSIINLPPRAADPATGGLSILDEARFLFHRDRTDPATLLRMITLNAAAPLALDPKLFLLRPDSVVAGLAAIPFQGNLPDDGHPFASCLVHPGPPVLL